MRAVATRQHATSPLCGAFVLLCGAPLRRATDSEPAVPPQSAAAWREQAIAHAWLMEKQALRPIAHGLGVCPPLGPGSVANLGRCEERAEEEAQPMEEVFVPIGQGGLDLNDPESWVF